MRPVRIFRQGDDVVGKHDVPMYEAGTARVCFYQVQRSRSQCMNQSQYVCLLPGIGRLNEHPRKPHRQSKRTLDVFDHHPLPSIHHHFWPVSRRIRPLTSHTEILCNFPAPPSTTMAICPPFTQ